MQRGRSGRDDFFGFGDRFGGSGGFDRPGSLMSGFFGGRNPFDDPFFTQPFGGMTGPSFFGRSVFGAGGNPFGDPIHGGFVEHQAPQPKTSKGPIIQELSSDDEVDEQEEGRTKKRANTSKHARLGKEPYVLEPDDELYEKNSRVMQREMEFQRVGPSKPQSRSYSFHSSTVTYGGPGGAYYTSSTTRRSGGDGVTVEESREADTTTGKATHRISRGLGDMLQESLIQMGELMRFKCYITWVKMSLLILRKHGKEMRGNIYLDGTRVLTCSVIVVEVKKQGMQGCKLDSSGGVGLFQLRGSSKSHKPILTAILLRGPGCSSSCLISSCDPLRLQAVEGGLITL
ncbi:hypothetical protein Taro_031820 [Colocasia esculenta]|uniref:Uncharacterized protein n=1 Tax=Colocasia esculenta TaxID=4460 RepID=A0A843VT21_COLES|nr:hypothetical protein [Colocasia esculenta]